MKGRIAAIAMLAGATMMAQVSSAKFESATVNASPESDEPARYVTDSKKLTLQNQTLKDCLRIAYDAKVARVAAGAPKWVETQRFDIAVTTGSVVDDREMKATLQALLRTWFKLTIHRETKTVPGYALVVAKGGLKIRAAEPGPGRISARRGWMTGENTSMANLAQALSDMTNTPVMDMTAVPGVFTFELEWVPEVVQPGSLTAEDAEPSVLPDMPRGPALLAAVQQQLGLKLDGRKVPLEVLVIDQAERPKD